MKYFWVKCASVCTSQMLFWSNSAVIEEACTAQGQRYPAARLIEHATGTAPDPQPLLAALRRKYGELYRL